MQAAPRWVDGPRVIHIDVFFSGCGVMGGRDYIVPYRREDVPGI